MAGLTHLSDSSAIAIALWGHTVDHDHWVEAGWLAIALGTHTGSAPPLHVGCSRLSRLTRALLGHDHTLCASNTSDHDQQSTGHVLVFQRDVFPLLSCKLKDWTSRTASATYVVVHLFQPSEMLSQCVLECITSCQHNLSPAQLTRRNYIMSK